MIRIGSSERHRPVRPGPTSLRPLVERDYRASPARQWCRQVASACGPRHARLPAMALGVASVEVLPFLRILCSAKVQILDAMK